MGKTIKALKRNRKKYQEGGEVLSPEELMQQASNEVNQMIVDDFTDDPKYGNNAIAAQKALDEQNLTPQPVATEPALLEQTEEALAGPDKAPEESQIAQTSLLETTAAPAPAAPAVAPKETVRPYSPENESLQNYLRETGTQLTAELIKQRIDNLASKGSQDEPAIRKGYQQNNPELYYEAYPNEKPFDASSESIEEYVERSGNSATPELLLQAIRHMEIKSPRGVSSFIVQLEKKYPEAIYELYPNKRPVEEPVKEPVEEPVRPYSPKNESLENYLKETGLEISAGLIKQRINYLDATNPGGAAVVRGKYLRSNPDLYYEAYPQEKPFDAASETLDNYIKTTGNPATPELLLQAIEHAEKTISPQGVSSFVDELERKYPDAFYEVYPDRIPIPAYDGRNDLKEYLNQHQLDANPDLIKSRITYLESASPETVADTKRSFLTTYPNVYFQAFPNEAPGNRQFNPGDNKPIPNNLNYWAGTGKDFQVIYADPVEGPILREKFNKDLLNWETAQGYRTLEGPLYTYEKGDEQPNSSFFTSIEDFNAAKYYYEKAGNRYKEPVKETTEQSHYNSIENPNNIDIISQVEQRDFNSSFGTLLPQKNLTEADFNPAGKGGFVFDKNDFAPIPAQYKNENDYLKAVQSYNQVVSSEISDDAIQRYSNAIDVYKSADSIENSMEWIMLKDSLFLNYPEFVTGALQSQTKKGDPRPTLVTHRSLTPEDFLSTLREWEQNNAAPEELPETDEAEIIRQQQKEEEARAQEQEQRQIADENYVFEPEVVLESLPLTDDGFIDISEELLFSDEYAAYRDGVNYNKKIQNEMGWANFTEDSPQPLPSDYGSVNNYITAALKWNMVQQAKKDFGPDVVIAKSFDDVVYNEWGSLVVDETLGTAENPLPPTSRLADMPLWVSKDAYAKYRNPELYNPLTPTNGNQYDNYKELVDNLAIWNLDEVAHYERRVAAREQAERNAQAAKERRERNKQLQEDSLLDPVTDVDAPVDTGESVDVPVDPITDVDVPVDPVTDVDVPVDTGEDNLLDPVTDVDVPVDTGEDSLLDPVTDVDTDTGMSEEEIAAQLEGGKYDMDNNWLGLDPLQALKVSTGMPIEGVGEGFDRLNLSPEDQIRMDITGDGRITSQDALMILLNYEENGKLKDFLLGLPEDERELLRESVGGLGFINMEEYGFGSETPVDPVTDVDVPADTDTDVDVPVDPVTDVDVPVDTGEDSLLEYQPPQYFKGDAPPSMNQFRNPSLPLDAFDRALDAYIEAQDFQFGDDRPVKRDGVLDSVYNKILAAWQSAQDAGPVDTDIDVDTPIDTGEDSLLDPVTDVDVPVDPVTDVDVPVDPVTDVDVPADPVTDVDVPVDTDEPLSGNTSPEIPTGLPPGYRTPDYKYGDPPPPVPPAISEAEYALNFPAWQAAQDAGPVDPVTDVDVPADPVTDVDVPADPVTDVDVPVDPVTDINPDDYDNDDDLIDAINDNLDSDVSEKPTDSTQELDASDYIGEVSELEGIFSGKEYKDEMVLKYTPRLQELYNKYTPYIKGDDFSDIPPAMSQENPPSYPGTIYDESRYSTEELKSMLMKNAEYQIWKYEKELYDNAVALYNERQGINPDDYDNDDDLIDAINDNIDSDGANQMSETTRTETSSNVSLANRNAANAPMELKYKNPTVTTPPSMSASDVETGPDSGTITADAAIQAVGTGEEVTDAAATGVTAPKTLDPLTGLPALQGEIKDTDKVTGPDEAGKPTGADYTAATIEPEEGEDPLKASAATMSAEEMANIKLTASATGPGAGSATAATFSEEALGRTGLKAVAKGRTETTLNAASVATAATAFDSVRNTKSFEALSGIAETRREAMEADPEYIEALDTLSGEELQAKLQDIPSVKSYLRAESTMLRMLENAGAKRIAEVEGPEVASTYSATTISPANLLQLTEIAKTRGVDIASLPQYDLLKQRQGVKLTEEELSEMGGTAAKLLGDGELVPTLPSTTVQAEEVGVSADLKFLSSEGQKIEDLPEFGQLTKLDDLDMTGYQQAKIIREELSEEGITELDLEGRTALIAEDELQGTAAEIGTVPTFQATTKQFATQELRETAAIEMLTVVAELPEDVAKQVSQDPAQYDGATDTDEATKVASKIAALPAEALVSTQMETLIAGMETGEVPAWAKPAVAAIDARMAQRGLSASTVGRDALFNAIIQSALPIATANAQALQQRAAQNLSMEQQNAVTFAQNEMTLRMQNLANTQTAASQSAAMAQEMIVKNVLFEQQQIAQRNQEQQQINLQNIQNQQRVADQAAQFAQQNALAEFTEQSRQDYELLKAKIADVSTALNVDEQMRLKQYEAQISKSVANAQLKQDMEKANLNASLSYDLQRLTEQNAAAKDTMTAENQERLVELQTLVDFRKTNVAMSQQMDMANLSNNQQIEMAVLQNKAQVDAVNFTEANRLRLAELNAIIARQVRVAELNQRIGEVNLDASVKLELTELSEANATARANMSVEQQTRLANLNTLVDFKKTQAQLTQQMELANLSNEQQVRIAVLSDRATADQQNFTEANRFELQRLTTAAQILSSNEQLRLNADMARLSTEEKVALANLTAQNQFDATSMSAENTAELQRYEKQMAAAQVNAQLAQQMGLQELSNAQQTAMFNAQVNSNLDFKAFDAAQQVELANSAFMQTMTINEFNAEQQAAIQNATMLTQVNLAGADQATKLAVTNASNFLQMNMANLSNKQQVAVLNAQIEQQRLINNVSAKNAAAQFSAANQQQADLFMANLGVEIEKYNTSAMIAREQFNATEKNRQAAIDAGNELEAARLTAQLKTDISKFNAQQELAREQWNAANAQAVEQSNVQWRRQANLADTAAQNAANQQNAQIAFNLTSQEQTQLWQQLRDDAAYIRQSYENKEQRNAQLLATAIGNEKVVTGLDKYNTLLGIED